MAISTRGNGLLSRLKALTRLKKFNHTLAEGELQAPTYPEMSGHIDTSNWKKVDSRTFGVTRSMIPAPSWIVLKVLQSEGFEAYLVGGCVRDLLLNRIPKDFDVITTANLKQIKKQFHRAQIVGQRFPICRVQIKGSVIEVSSFETVAQHVKEREEIDFTERPSGFDKKDFVRWRNCMHRDFTINSLFFDPFTNKIYDYANGMMDLKSLKLRTLIPAQLSFQEDCARILRGLRIAARLGLSFSKDTETAIHNLSSSIMSLANSRIMMELNYMLSYGAAEPSLHLLRRFNLLEILLPFHAAYLAQQSGNQTAKRSMMLMKLFFSLDKLVTCDRPSDCSLWVGLLAFHLALVNNPQDSLVVWTLSFVLYYGDWKKGLKFAREHAQTHVNFVPEVSEACDSKSDSELAKEVTQLASLVQDSVDALTERDSLYESMSRYPIAPCSGLVFIPKKTGKEAAQIFSALVKDVEFYEEGRESFNINYDLLGKGVVNETRYVLGKVILDTMSSGVVRGGRVVVREQMDHQKTVDRQVQLERAKKQKLIEKCNLPELEMAKKKPKAAVNEDRQVIADQKEVNVNEKCWEMAKDRKVATKHSTVETCQFPEVAISMTQENVLQKKKCHSVQREINEKKPKVVETDVCQERAKKHQKVVDKQKRRISQDEVIKKKQKVVGKCHLFEGEEIKKQGKVLEKKCCFPKLEGFSVMNDEQKKELVKARGSQLRLSGLFR